MLDSEDVRLLGLGLPRRGGDADLVVALEGALLSELVDLPQGAADVRLRGQVRGGPDARRRAVQELLVVELSGGEDFS